MTIVHRSCPSLCSPSSDSRRCPPTHPADLEARAWAAIRQEGARTEEGIGQSTEAVDELSKARHRRSARRAWVPLLAGAAAVAVIGTVTVVAVTGDDDPDATTVALAGTDVEPNAEGQAEITSTPSGLLPRYSSTSPACRRRRRAQPPRLAAQRRRRGHHRHIPRGRQGSDDIILWSGVDVADFPTLTVTLQQVGGGAESSGIVVLRGDIGSD